ncbi:complement component C8 alpha chain-like [Branchiostoma floridae x Branchiostoma japonicum]
MNGRYKAFSFLLALAVLTASLETGQCWSRRRRRSAPPPPPLPQNCAVTDWSPWGACSASCGGGTHTRSRTVVVPAAHGGTPCPALQDSQPCNTITCPVDCQVGEFGDWSVCDPCLHTQSRYSPLVRPSQFGGSPCTKPLVETRGCSSNRTCPLTSACTSRQFKCVTTGRCVPASFRCNGDDDCGDQSDEQECPDVQNLCEGKTVEGLIPNIDIAGSGSVRAQNNPESDNIQTLTASVYTEDTPNMPETFSCPSFEMAMGNVAASILCRYNVLTEELSGLVLDNSKYGGQCRTAYSGDHGKTFRLPHNTQFYRFQVVADTSFRAEQFSSSKQFYQETTANSQRDIHAGASASFSVRVVADTSFRAEQFSSSKQFYQETTANRQRDIHAGASAGASFLVFSASAEVASSQSHGNHDVIRSSQSSDSALFTVSNQIELAQFRMNGDNNFILTDSFYIALEELPVVYSYAEYKKLIVDFGTHYVSAGSLGGQYRYAYRYNRRNLTESGLSDEQQKSCLSVEAKASFLGIGISGGYKNCQDNRLSQQTAGSFTLAARDSVSFVKGGTSETAGSLAYTNQPMTDKYQAWLDDVKNNPAVISVELYPLSELVAGVSLAPVKKRHLARALVQYLDEFHPCKCAPCRNNGKAVLIGTACECVCAEGTYGASCETVADPSLAVKDVDGSWSCWTGWSACTSRCGGGSSGRKRACDNPVNSGGGQFCTGDNMDSKTCNVFPCGGSGTTLFPEAPPTPAPRTGGKLPPGQVATVSVLAVVGCLAVVGALVAYRFGRTRRHGSYRSMRETTPVMDPLRGASETTPIVIT